MSSGTHPHGPQNSVIAPDGTILRHGNTTAYRAKCRCPECCEAKRLENERRFARRRPPPMSRDEFLRRRRILSRARRDRDRDAQSIAAKRAADHHAASLAAARAEVSGELAQLVAEQEADDRRYRCMSFPFIDEIGPHCHWDDPTADAALERVA